jgi:hypothetical protein
LGVFTIRDYDAGRRAIHFYIRQTPLVPGRNYVFYATPPALQCMTAYFDYCRLKAENSDQLPEPGFLVLSSYGPIRVYRVST